MVATATQKKPVALSRVRALSESNGIYSRCG